MAQTLLHCSLLVVVVLWSSSVGAEDNASKRSPVVMTPEGDRIHKSAILIDGHNDMPWEIRKQGSRSFERLNIAEPQKTLQTDIPRLRKGGMGAQFWSVWVPAATAYDGTALVATLEQIDLVNAMIDRYPETFELALTSDDIRRIHAEGKIASLIGVEGGHCIENSLNVLRQLYRLGARYMTLTHADTIDWADSGTDEPRHGGLTPFGEEVIAEMNRLGMMVDISHVSVDTMKDVLKITEAPVIFSHSSARAVADSPRNVPDDVLKLVKENDGVVMVNFFSGFVVPEASDRYLNRLKRERELKATEKDAVKVQAELRRAEPKGPMARGTIHDLIDHIDHIVKVAGINHVGLGSDYDGVSSLPTQLDDVSCYPFITQALLDRGYGENDIKKVLGENLLRVMKKVEEAAEKPSATDKESE